MIFPDARIDGIHHVEAANVAETLAKVILHKPNQSVRVLLRGDGLPFFIYGALLCAPGSLK